MFLVVSLETLLKILGQPQELVAYCFLRGRFQLVTYSLFCLFPVRVRISCFIIETKLVDAKYVSTRVGYHQTQQKSVKKFICANRRQKVKCSD